MKRKGIWVIVSVLVVLGLLLGGFGCAAPAPTPTPTPTPAPSPTAPEVITLVYHNAFPPAGLNLADRWWMDEVEKRTEGRVKFERIFGGSLGTLDEMPMAVKARSVDLSQVSSVYNPGLYPRSAVTFLPFVTNNVLAQHIVGQQLFETDLVKAEYDVLNQKFLFNGMWAQLQLMSYDPIRTIDDLRQVKIRGHGGSADALAAMGIVTYAIPWGEYPAAAERRVVDAGIQGTPTDAYDFGFADIYNYWTDLVWYYFPMTAVMNLDAWNSLPADIQQTIQYINDVMPIQLYDLYHQTEVDAERAMLTEKGIVKVQFEDTDEVIAQGGQPVWDQWVADRTAEGINAQAILDWYFDRLRWYGG